MRLISFTQDPKLISQMLDFKFKLLSFDSRHLLPSRQSEEALYAATNPFFRHGQMQNFLVEENGQTLGAVSAIIDDLLPPSLGVVGFYQCVEDQAVSDQLLGAATSWLAEKGKTDIRGPMDLSIWTRYRFKTSGFDKPVHSGEPTNPEYYPKFWEAFGFKEDTFWRTWDLPRLVIEQLYGAVKKKAEALPGWRLQRIVERSENVLRDYHRLLLNIFEDNYLATKIDYTEFEFAYGGLMQILPLIHLYFVMGPDQTAKGICLGHTDFSIAYKAAQGGTMKPEYLMAAAQESRSYILNMMGLDRASRSLGGVDVLMNEGLAAALEGPYTHFLGYLVKEGKSIFAKLAPATREYKMYRLTR